MPQLQVEGDKDVQKWVHRTVDGSITKFVAYGNAELSTRVKYIRTMLANSAMDRSVLEAIFSRVYVETVLPFLGATWNQPERLERFERLRAALLG